ncbi:MAG: flagellar biosynthetic protein FliR [Brevinema sp.]
MLFEYFQRNFQIFLVIFVRVFGLLITMPVFNTNVPAMARAGLGFFVALLASPMVVGMQSIPVPRNLSEFGIVVLSSFIVGIAIGFVIQVTVSAVQLSSTVFSTTMGLSLSETMDPLTETSIPAMGNFLSAMMLLLFIRTESHIMFIEVIIRSFRELPVIDVSGTKGILMAMKTASSVIWTLALRLSMPIVAVTLLLDLAMGIIGRVAPQFNVMIMGWNIKLLLGFTMLWLIIPGIMDFGSILFKELHDSVIRLLLITQKGGA